jgi:hypothetical protein
MGRFRVACILRIHGGVKPGIRTQRGKEKAVIKGLVPSFVLGCQLLAACGGCVPEFDCTTGTIGEEGRAVFNFEQTLNDVSEASGNAFSAGTVSHMNVRPYDPDHPLPSYVIESTDDAVLSVDEVLSTGEYPVTLGMNGEGTADLQLVRQGEDDIIDHVTLRVAEPDGLALQVVHPVFMTDWDPDAILVPVGGAGCRVYLFPYELSGGERTMLYGEYELAASGADAVFQLEDVTSFNAFAMKYEYHVAASGVGTSVVTFAGLRGLAVTRTLTAVELSDVDGLEIVASSTVMTVGRSYVITALQRVTGDDLCGGFEAGFVSDHPDVLELAGSFFGINTTTGYPRAPGTAVVTATLADNPAMSASITVRVTEHSDE